MRLGTVCLAAVLAASSAAWAQDAPVTTAVRPPADTATEAPKLNCDIGPIEKTFGGNRWLVVGCEDGLTLTIVAADGNPAAPFVFVMAPKDGSYSVTGDGAGNAEAAKAAFAEIKALDDEAIGELFDQVREAGKNAQPPVPKKGA